MANREDLIKVFEDTQEWYKTDKDLKEAVVKSIRETTLYAAGEYPVMILADSGRPVAMEETVSVTPHKSFEAAMELRKRFPDKRIAVHNFASATNPGGGVVHGSSAQEECLCRCSTLYQVLNTRQLWEGYYGFHRSRHDVLYTDACIYSPGIWIIKTDEELPRRMPKENWCQVDVITCAAPNLRANPYNSMNPGSGVAAKVTDKELLEIHKKRAKQMLNVALANGAQVLVLGAFGCGAFQNNPEVVARAYKEVLKEFAGAFEYIEFAVYCSPRSSINYDVFKRVLG